MKIILQSLKYSLFFCLIFHPVVVFSQEIQTSKEFIEKPLLDSCLYQNLSFFINTGWTNTGTTNGIKNFQKNINNSTTKAYKGVCVINRPIKSIYAIIADVKTHSKWVKFCRYSQIVSTESPTNTIIYYNFDVPWPLANRDVVVDTKTDINWEKGRVSIKSLATRHSDIPVKKGCIRLTDSRQTWLLEKITPTSTKVTFTSFTPLKGSVPKIFNKIASNMLPRSTLNRLNKLAMNVLPQYIVKASPVEKEQTITDLL